jgi:hypothetical protein
MNTQTNTPRTVVAKNLTKIKTSPVLYDSDDTTGDEGTNTLRWNPHPGRLNYEPAPSFMTPVTTPTDSPDGYSPFANQYSMGQACTTQKDFYPISPSPIGTPNGPGTPTVTIGGQVYTVTPKNAGHIARMYINADIAAGSDTFVGANAQANANMLSKQILALAGTQTVSQDPLTGQQISDNSVNDSLKNRFLEVVYPTNNAGLTIVDNGNAVVNQTQKTTSKLSTSLQSGATSVKNFINEQVTAIKTAFTGGEITTEIIVFIGATLLLGFFFKGKK